MHIYSLYKTTNIVNQKIYYGVHRETKWPQQDGYLGSGVLLKRAIEKYGRCHFKREVICISDNSDYIYFLESQLVNEAFIRESSNYNICGGGLGASIHSEDTKRKMSIANSGDNNPNRGRVIPSDERHRRRVAATGKRHTQKTKDRLSAARRGNNNPNFIGWYVTPFGMFASSHGIPNVSNTTLQKWCMHSDRVISNQAYSHSKLLQTFGPTIVGKKFKDIGFAFLPA